MSSQIGYFDKLKSTVGSELVLGTMNQYGAANLAIGTSWVPVGPASTKGGIFFIVGKNASNANVGFWLVAHTVDADNVVVVISSDNSTGLTINFRGSDGILQMYVTTGAMHIDIAGWWI